MRDEAGGGQGVRPPQEEQLEVVVADRGHFGEEDGGQQEEGQPLHAKVKTLDHLGAATRTLEQKQWPRGRGGPNDRLA